MKQKIGLFYGSDTGFTEAVAEQIASMFEPEIIDVYNIDKSTVEDFSKYDYIIIGLSTWHDGQLQYDWDEFYEDFKTIDFTGKTVALFGLGDQAGYAHYFIDGVGILGEVIYNNGGELIGVWPTEDYDFDHSKAEFQEGWFMGLAIDEDNQPELTEARVQQWVAQIKEEFGVFAS